MSGWCRGEAGNEEQREGNSILTSPKGKLPLSMNMERGYMLCLLFSVTFSTTFVKEETGISL